MKKKLSVSITYGNPSVIGNIIPTFYSIFYCKLVCIIWFIRRYETTFQVWISDTGESQNLPWLCPSTMALAARYKLDLSRKEPSRGDISSGISEMLSELSYCYRRRLKDAQSAVDMRNEYDILRERQREIRNNYMIFDDEPKWYRVDGVNMFHVCATLNFSKVTTSLSYKWLDCNYVDGNFMFALYADDVPNTTKSLIVGDFPMYDESARQCFLLSNSFVMQSQTAYPSPNSGFFLEDEWGLRRQSRSEVLHALAYDELQRLRENANDAKTDVASKQKEVDAKQREINNKQIGRASCRERV